MSKAHKRLMARRRRRGCQSRGGLARSFGARMFGGRRCLTVAPCVLKDALVEGGRAGGELEREVDALALGDPCAILLEEKRRVARCERGVALLREARQEAGVGEPGGDGGLTDEGVGCPSCKGFEEEHRVGGEFCLAPPDELLAFCARYPEADPSRRPQLERSDGDVGEFQVWLAPRRTAEVLEPGSAGEVVGIEHGCGLKRLDVAADGPGDVEGLAGVEFRVLAGVADVEAATRFLLRASELGERRREVGFDGVRRSCAWLRGAARSARCLRLRCRAGDRVEGDVSEAFIPGDARCVLLGDAAEAVLREGCEGGWVRRTLGREDVGLGSALVGSECEETRVVLEGAAGVVGVPSGDDRRCVGGEGPRNPDEGVGGQTGGCCVPIASRNVARPGPERRLLPSRGCVPAGAGRCEAARRAARRRTRVAVEEAGWEVAWRTAPLARRKVAAPRRRPRPVVRS